MAAHVLEYLPEEMGLALLRAYPPFVKPGGHVIFIAPHEVGVRSNPTHVEWRDPVALRALTAQVGVVPERAISWLALMLVLAVGCSSGRLAPEKDAGPESLPSDATNDVQSPDAPNSEGTAGTAGTAGAAGTGGTGGSSGPSDAGSDVWSDKTCAPALIGSFEGIAHRLAKVDDRIYVANGAGGLMIYDVSEPTHPIHLGSARVSGYAYDVAVSGAYAYVAAYDAGLAIVDISDPMAAHVVGTLSTKGRARAVAISGNQVYVTDALWNEGPFGRELLYAGFQIIDASDPAHPRTRGHLEWTDAVGQDLKVVGNDVFVAGGPLLVVDVSNPDEPRLRSSTSVPGVFAFGVDIFDDRAAVADASGGLQLFDITNRDAPVPRGRVRTAGYSYRVAVEGAFAYLADSNDERNFFDDQMTGLRVIDISDSDAPVLAESINMPGESFDVATDVVNRVGYAYVADGYGGLEVVELRPGGSAIVGAQRTPSRLLDLRAAGNKIFASDGEIVDVSDPSTPHLDATLPVTGRVDILGTRVYVAAGRSGLQVVDVTNTRAPELRESVPIVGNSRFVRVADGFAYVATSAPTALHVFDLSDPDKPRPSGQVPLSVEPEGMDAAHGFAYVATGSKGLQIVDARDATAPSLRAHVDRVARDVQVMGALLYVAGDGLDILDVADPDAPRLLGNAATNLYGAYGLAVVDGLAYTGSELGQRLVIVDVTNPLRPTRISSVFTPGWVTSVAVAGQRAFVSDSFTRRGIQIASVAVPRSAAVVATLDVGPQYVSRMIVRGRFGYLPVSDPESSLQIVDLDDPRAPKRRGTLALGGVQDIGVTDRAVVALRTDGIDIVDASDPDRPIRAGSIELSGTPYAVATQGQTIFVTVGSDLQIYTLQDPSAPALIGTLPIGVDGGDVVVSADRAYVYAHGMGVQIIDVAAPEQPRILGFVPNEARTNLFVVGTRLYVTGDSTGMQIIDVADPTAPRVLSTFPVAASVHNIQVAGRYAYLAHRQRGIVVLDVADPMAPKIVVDSIPGFPENASEITENGGYLYVATYGQLVTVSPFACAPNR